MSNGLLLVIGLANPSDAISVNVNYFKEESSEKLFQFCFEIEYRFDLGRLVCRVFLYNTVLHYF